MAAGDTRVAYLVNTVHHEMDIAVHSHCIYEYVWLPVIAKQLVLEKEPAGQST